MKDQQYYKELGATGACAIWVAEAAMQVNDAQVA